MEDDALHRQWKIWPWQNGQDKKKLEGKNGDKVMVEKERERQREKDGDCLTETN